MCSRGINPPHRVKSISMTSFSDKEIKQLKEGGNEVRGHWARVHTCTHTCSRGQVNVKEKNMHVLTAQMYIVVDVVFFQCFSSAYGSDATFISLTLVSFLQGGQIKGVAQPSEEVTKACT